MCQEFSYEMKQWVYIHSANIGTIEKVRGIIHPTLPESFYVKTFLA